jgi:hypothetical protein
MEEKEIQSKPLDKEIKTGLVGVFDILGYQNIIVNNQIEYVAKLITEVIQQLPTEVITTLNKQMLSSWVDSENPSNLIKHNIISDTIIIYMPDDDSLKKIGEFFSYLTFFLFSNYFLNKCFCKGIPLRGALSYGQYFVSQNTFAGKPLVDCYSLGNKLEFSGCVLTHEFTNYLQNNKPNEESLIKNYAADYLVSLKNNISEKYPLLNWVSSTPALRETIPDDIRQFVFDSFKSHNKDILPEVFRKMENTEMTIRYFKSLKKYNDK